jgi:hypothetical protein
MHMRQMIGLTAHLNSVSNYIRNFWQNLASLTAPSITRCHTNYVNHKMLRFKGWIQQQFHHSASKEPDHMAVIGTSNRVVEQV